MICLVQQYTVTDKRYIFQTEVLFKVIVLVATDQILEQHLRISWGYFKITTW